MMHANPLQRAKKLTGFFVKSVSFLHFLSGFVFAGIFESHKNRTRIAQALKTRGSKNYSSTCDTGQRSDEWYAQFYLALMILFQKAYRDSTDYYLSQYISEYLKNLGFDGIMFRSSVNRHYLDGGINYTFFNYQKCKVVSSSLYYLKEVQLVTEPALPSADA